MHIVIAGGLLAAIGALIGKGVSMMGKTDSGDLICTECGYVGDWRVTGQSRTWKIPTRSPYWEDERWNQYCECPQCGAERTLLLEYAPFGYNTIDHGGPVSPQKMQGGFL